jgi:hypothetical protein
MPRRIVFPTPWPGFRHRPTLIGDWVAVWRLPRAWWGPHVVCDACNAALAQERWIWVACYPSREVWIQEGLAAAAPQGGEAYCPRCARQFLPPWRPPKRDLPWLLTSHSVTGRPLVPVTGFCVTVAGALGRPLHRGWRDRLRPRSHA